MAPPVSAIDKGVEAAGVRMRMGSGGSRGGGREVEGVLEGRGRRAFDDQCAQFSLTIESESKTLPKELLI